MKSHNFTLVTTALFSASMMTACGVGSNANMSNSQPYKANCWDGSKTSSSTSQAAANAACPADTRLVTDVPDAVYSGTDVNEKLAVFKRLNEDRALCGFGKVKQNKLLDISAQNHGNYISLGASLFDTSENANKAKFTGVTPSDRVRGTGYISSTVNEILSSQLLWGNFFGDTLNLTSASTPLQIKRTSDPSQVDALRNTYAMPYQLVASMSGFREFGLGTYKTNEGSNTASINSKGLVLDVATASGQVPQLIAANTVVSFPCDGSTDISPYFISETPISYSEKKSDEVWGHPILIMSNAGSPLKLTSAQVTKRGGAELPLKQLAQVLSIKDAPPDIQPDMNGLLGSNQIIVTPKVALAENSTYDVVLQGTSTSLISAANPKGSWNKSFSFQTSVYTH